MSEIAEDFQELRKMGMHLSIGPHRIGYDIELEVKMHHLKYLLDNNYIDSVCASELSVAQIERACKIVKLSYLETEYSIGKRFSEENILPICKELGITFLSYSPLDRGY